MKRFKNILYFADGEMHASTALHRAVRLAETNHARLTVIDVLAPVETPDEVTARFGVGLHEILCDRRRETLEGLVAPFLRDDVLLYTEVLIGTPFVEVIRAVRRSGYDLVVKAARAPAGIGERVFGSADLHLLRKCPCPVWIDRPSPAASYARVLAAVDPAAGHGGDCDRMVMDLASSLAERESAELSVVHAWRLDGESMLRNGRFRLPEKELEDLLQGLETRHRDGLAALLTPYGKAVDPARVHLRNGQPAEVIRDVARQLPADLIVMGTVGRLGIPGFFIGNTAEEVIQTTLASVLAVKPAGFVSPVV